MIRCSKLEEVISNYHITKVQNPPHSVNVREIRWKCIFRANFRLLPHGFDVGALIPQGLAGSPNYFRFWNLVTY